MFCFNRCGNIPTIIIGPRGATGATGSTGNTGATGATGADGVADTLSLGALSFCDKLEDAKIVDRSPERNHVFDFVLPAISGQPGEKGERGSQGEQGPQGPQGVMGATGATGATGPASVEALYSMRYDGNTGAFFNNTQTILKAPDSTECLAFDNDTITIQEGGYYEIFMTTTCDTTTLGATLYGGVVLQVNGDAQQDCQCLIPNSKYAILVAQQVFQFNAGDTLKIKNENGTVGSICGHLVFQIRKLYFE